MNSSKKAALAGCCGAVFGFATATQFLHGFWTLFGVIAGGIVGWLCYDLKGFITIFRHCLATGVNEAFDFMKVEYESLLTEPWKRIFKLARGRCFDFFVHFQSLGAAVCTIALCHYVVTAQSFSVIFGLVIYGLTWVVGCIFVLHFLGTLALRENRDLLLVSKPYILCENPWKRLLWCNPVTLPFTVLFAIARVVRWLIANIPMIVTVFCRLVWYVLVNSCILAHSDGRLASACGGALGALVGLATHQLIIAVIAGAVIGWVASYVGGFFSKAYVRLLDMRLFKDV